MRYRLPAILAPGMASPSSRPRLWRRLAPLVGILTALLGVTGSVISSSSPDPNASGAQVLAFYAAHSTAQSMGAFLQALGFIFFVFFAGVLRSRLRTTPGGEGLASLALVGAGILLVSEAVSTGLSYTLANSPSLSPDAAQALNVLSSGTLVGTSGTFIFTLSAGLAILIDGSLPKWLGFVALAMALLVLTPLEFLAFVILVAWTIILSLWIFLHSGSVAPTPASP